MALESRTALRYLTGLRALPWAISTVFLRLLQSPWATLEALLRKLGLNLRITRNPARSGDFPPPIDRTWPIQQISTASNSVLHFVTNCLPYTQAGYTIRTHNILAAQLAAGIKATAVTRYGYPINQGKFFTGEKTELPAFNSSTIITYHHLIPTSIASKSELNVAADKAIELSSKLKPAVIHGATDFINGEIAAAVADSLNLPMAYEVRGFLEQSWLTKSSQNSIDSPFYQEFLLRETQVMQRADVITTLSETMKAEIINRGIAKEKIFITPNAVADSLLTESKFAQTARSELGLEQIPTFGIATTLYPFENVSLLIKVLDELFQSGHTAQLLIVGDGPELSSLQQQAAASPNSNYIKLVGRKPFDQTITHYQAMDVFVVPRTNSLVTQLVTPLKPVEAMALNRPVIASNLPALAELITPGETGLLVEPDSLTSLTEAVGRLLYDSDQRHQLASSAKEWVASSRTWSKVAQQYQEIYQQLGKR
ncbi:MAG: glycosyltransferase family 4 protein [Candidatus Nanopelagicales bacterium]